MTKKLFEGVRFLLILMPTGYDQLEVGLKASICSQLRR